MTTKSLITSAVLAVVMCFPIVVKSQTTTLGLEYRFNPILSYGFREPLRANTQPGFFTMQRTRAIINYEDPKRLKAQFVFQDRRAWGETDIREDASELGVWRAWVENYFTPDLSLKIGRQGLIYDDQHIFGEFNWAGTAAHDAVKLKYEKNNIKLHAVGAYSSGEINQFQREPYLQNLYKNMQMGWANYNKGKWYISGIFVNHGLETPDTTVSYTQTYGIHAEHKFSNKLSMKGFYYLQGGENQNEDKVNGNFWALQLTHNPTSQMQFELGVESISGTDLANVEAGRTNTFDRLYGLRHAHFGHIDYFYVNIDPVFGLENYFFKTRYKTGKWTFSDNVHYFATQNQAYESPTFEGDLGSNLGVENDIKIKYQMGPDYQIQFGHAIYWGTETLDAMFGRDTGRSNQVFYMVIVVNPNLFELKKKQE